MALSVMTTATSPLSKFYRSLFTLLLMLLVLTACSTPQRQRGKSETVPSEDPISSLLKETPHPENEAALEKMGYSIQVGAFANLDNAVRLERLLESRGIDAYYFLHESGLYKVRFGNHGTYKPARTEAERLQG